MPKIANWKIETEISALSPFINYNGSIVATSENGIYAISHWNTEVLKYNINTREIMFLFTSSYSQTTSTLVGRIVRNLPRQAVVKFIVEKENLSRYDLKRIVSMARL
jgi:hypothetical protein